MIGSDLEGRLREAPRPELREHGRISGACFDAALGVISGLKVSFSCTMSVAISVKQTIIQCTTACQAAHALPNILAFHCGSVLEDGTETYA